MFMPIVNSAYSFTFKKDFDKLDGIYLVLQHMTFEEVVKDKELDPLKTYLACQLDEEKFKSDLVSLNLREETFLKLSDVDTKEVFAIPYCLLQNIPDHSIKKYKKLVFTVDLGAFENMEQLTHIEDIVNQHVKSALGIDSKSILYEYGEEYLSRKEYEKREEERIKRKKNCINPFSTIRDLSEKIKSLNSRIAALEEIAIHK